MPPFSRFSLLSTLPLLLLLACYRREGPEPDAVPLPAELKAYTLFQPGTYWIYQDSASRRLDSVWVVSTDMSIYRSGGGSDPVDMKHEDFRLRTRSTQGGADQIYSVRRVCDIGIPEDATNFGPCWFIQRGESLPNIPAEEGGVEVFPYRIERDKATLIYAEIYTYWHSQPQTIGGQRYEGILEVKRPADAFEGYKPSQYYWAPGKGIVQQRVRVNNVQRTRTLVRSNIVQ